VFLVHLHLNVIIVPLPPQPTAVIVSCHPLVAPPSCPLFALAYCCFPHSSSSCCTALSSSCCAGCLLHRLSTGRPLVILSSYCLVMVPSCHLIKPASCHIISCHPLVALLSCSLIPLAGWLLCCLSLHHLLVLLLCQPSLPCYCFAVVHC
jgi:hypothetical protein